MSTAHLKYWPPNLPRSINSPERRVDENLRLSAKRDPTGRAIVFYGEEIFWRDLDASVDRIAAYLQHECGIERGDRVILFSQNCPQFVIAYYAILRAGAVVVPVNPMNRRGEVAHYISETQAKAAFCGQELIDEILPAVGQSSLQRIISIVYADFVLAHVGEALPPSLTAARMSFDHPAVVDWQDASASMQAPKPIPFTSDEIAVLPFTSGSTGLPKGCVHTHETVMSTAVSGAVWEGLDATSIALVCTPLCHVTGMQLGMNRCVYAGATMVLMHRWSPQFAAALIERHHCTHWNAVPVMFVDVISHPEIEPAKLASLRVMSGGGAAMPQAMAQKIKDVYGVDFLEGYGMTESIAQTHLNPPNRPKNQCLGIPIFDVESMVIDPQTGQPLPSGEVGEIVLRGPQVFKGY
ncbi:MAG: AMP-binding protein, partial [Proteobacteria bacterium]|nr:AMP-binding protein [Pseudomonadota bacterium]